MPNMMDMTAEEIADQLRITAIAQQNDAFRRDIMRSAQAGTPQGRVMVTRAIEEAGVPFRLAAVRAVALYNTFTEESDPYGDHSFGVVNVSGRKVWWKIDLYDTAYEYGSEDAANTTVTRRVLTIMFPDDY